MSRMPLSCCLIRTGDNLFEFIKGYNPPNDVLPCIKLLARHIIVNRSDRYVQDNRLHGRCSHACREGRYTEAFGWKMTILGIPGSDQSKGELRKTLDALKPVSSSSSRIAVISGVSPLSTRPMWSVWLL